MHSRFHRPKLVIFGICIGVLISLIAVFRFMPQLAAIDRVQQSTAIEKLRSAIANDYSYRDLHGVDWDQRLDQFQERMKSAKTPKEFADLAAEYLKVAKDIHIWLKVDNQTIGTFQSTSRPNFNPRLLPSVLKKFKQYGKTVIVGDISDKLKYIAIGTWDHREPESMETAISAVREAARQQVPLIIDVRPNSGGDELLARRVASLFVDKPTPYVANSNWANGQEGPIHQRILEPDSERLRHRGPCLVLMGQANMSSCESFLLMMRAAGVKLIGATSYGTSGNPKPHDLGNGVTVFLPSWRVLDLNGQLLEGKGVEPDVRIDAKPEEFSKSDPVLSKAISLIQLPQ